MNIQQTIDEFITHLIPDAEYLYLRDIKKGICSGDTDKLKALGFDISQVNILPCVVLYSQNKKRLYFIESATDRLIDEVRFKELEVLAKNVQKEKVFVTAFPDSQSFRESLEKLAWDTVAWMADAPAHLVHFEKYGKLEPR